MLFFSLLFSLLNSFSTSQSTPAASKAAVFLSINQGGNWVEFTDGMPEGVAPRTLVEANGNLYLSTHQHGVFKLAAQANTWKPIRKGLPFGAEFFLPTSLAVKGNFMVLGTYQHGTYISDDEGKSWRPASKDVTRCARTLLYNDEALLAGTETGIFHSLDNGDTWERLYADETMINVLAMSNDRLFIASQNGMGTIENNEVKWSTVTSGFALLQTSASGEYVYFHNHTGEIFRSTDGLNWEAQPVVNVLLSCNNLTDALWHGFRAELPTKEKNSNVFETSRGWIAMTGGGC